MGVLAADMHGSADWAPHNYLDNLAKKRDGTQ